MPSPRLRRALLAAVVLLGASPARAQDSAAAEVLFDRGVADMKDGKLDAACPELAESQRLDPRPGTLFTLATCEERAGKLATAVARYDDYLRLFAALPADQRARQKGREKVAESQRAGIAPQVPKLTLILPKSAPPGTKVSRDGVVLGGPALGIALPVDPGEHAVEIELPGGARSRQTVSLGKGDAKTVTLVLPAESAGATPSASAPVMSPSSSPTPPEPPSGPSGARRGLTFAAAGVGVVGLAVGTLFGARVLAKKTDIRGHCDGAACDETGLSAANDARSAGVASNVGFAVGLAGLGAAAVLWLTEPSSGATSASLRPSFDLRPGGIALGVTRTLP